MIPEINLKISALWDALVAFFYVAADILCRAVLSLSEWLNGNDLNQPIVLIIVIAVIFLMFTSIPKIAKAAVSVLGIGAILYVFYLAGIFEDFGIHFS